MRNINRVAGCFVLQMVVLVAARAWAAAPVNHAAVLAPFVNDDTLAAVYLDVASIKVAENAGELVSLLPKLSGDAQAWMMGAMMVDTLVQRFQQAGGQSLYAVAGLGDIHIDGGPLFIATARSGERPEHVEQFFRNVLNEIIKDSSDIGKDSLIQQIEIKRQGDAVLIGTKSTIARYGRLKPSARNDLVEALTSVSGDGALIAATFCPGGDYRRVSRELWPELPGALAPLRGELADRWLYFAAAINGPPQSKPRVVLQARDAESAAVFVKLYRNLPNSFDGIKEFGTPPPQVKQSLQMIVALLPPQQDGARVTMMLSMEQAQLATLQKLLGGATQKTMESAHHKQRINQVKQIALGMHNYYDTQKHLPPAAIRDKDGKPLLSWRVAILPYIEMDELYKKFHLDEPWDSPHNRTLIEKMPAIYADDDPALKHLVTSGKTTFQVPVGPETAFYNNDGTRFPDITDGTSQTIMIVEVEPLRAAIWTKPEDWEVDLKHPRRGIERSDITSSVAAWCDGSAGLIPTDTDEAKLRANLTRAGGELAKRP